MVWICWWIMCACWWCSARFSSGQNSVVRNSDCGMFGWHTCLQMIGLVLASYRTDNRPCSRNTCAFTAGHACKSPQPNKYWPKVTHEEAEERMEVEEATIYNLYASWWFGYVGVLCLHVYDVGYLFDPFTLSQSTMLIKTLCVCTSRKHLCFQHMAPR